MKQFTRKGLQEYLEQKINECENKILESNKGKARKLRQRVIALQQVYNKFFKD